MKTVQTFFQFLRPSVVALFIWFLSALTISAAAQNNEVALTIGDYFPMHASARSHDVFAVQGNVARRVLRFPAASLYIELPITGALSSPVTATKILGGQSFTTRSYSSLFVTPGLRLQIIPNSRLSPFLPVGGGLAHFGRASMSSSSSTNTDVLDVGGGLDWKISRFLILRGEVRDFYSGGPQLISGLTDRENQVVAAGGVAFRF